MSAETDDSEGSLGEFMCKSKTCSSNSGFKDGW